MASSFQYNFSNDKGVRSSLSSGEGGGFIELGKFEGLVKTSIKYMNLNWARVHQIVEKQGFEAPELRCTLMEGLEHLANSAGVHYPMEVKKIASLADSLFGNVEGVFLKMANWYECMLVCLEVLVHIEKSACKPVEIDTKAPLYVQFRQYKKAGEQTKTSHVWDDVSILEPHLEILKDQGHVHAMTFLAQDVCQTLHEERDKLDNASQSAEVNIVELFSHFMPDVATEIPELVHLTYKKALVSKMLDVFHGMCVSVDANRLKIEEFLRHGLIHRRDTMYNAFKQLTALVEKRKSVSNDLPSSFIIGVSKLVNRLKITRVALTSIANSTSSPNVEMLAASKEMVTLMTHLSEYKSLDAESFYECELRARTLLAKWSFHGSECPEDEIFAADFDVKDIECPICMDTMVKAVFVADGKVYCRDCIAKHLINSDISPLTGKKLKHKEFSKAFHIRQRVKKYNAWHNYEK